MKRIEERPPQTAMVVCKVLIVIIAVLVIILITGTIYGLVKREKPANPPPASETGVEENIFSSLGTLRVPTAGNDPETVIISIAFPYNKNDRPFAEELASRISWFKTAIFDYLGNFTAEEIETMDTDTINQELLKRFNAELRLGQIRELYITDFMRL
ncbi:MAG: flagellar basal body-associated FliL family protein [Treponema sp.]|nr:flagellar basal body-associated FliL family protein [Treponema sp.]